VSLVGSTLDGRYATIVCNGRMSFTFDHVQQLNISHMEFLACGLVMDLKYCSHMRYLLDVSCPHVALLVLRSSSVVLEYVRVMNSYGYGLLEWNVVGTSLINCQFYCSNWRSHKEKDRHEKVSTYYSCPSSSEHNEPGGNVLFVHQRDLTVPRNIHLYIFHSEFAYGVARKANSSRIIGGGGLGIYFDALFPATKCLFKCITVVCTIMFLLLEPTCFFTTEKITILLFTSTTPNFIMEVVLIQVEV